MTEEPPELAVYRRLHALAGSRVRGVSDPALDRCLAKTKAALIKELLRCVAAIERLPAAKDPELALEQEAARTSEAEYIRSTIREMGGTQQ